MTDILKISLIFWDFVPIFYGIRKKVRVEKGSSKLETRTFFLVLFSFFMSFLSISLCSITPPIPILLLNTYLTVLKIPLPLICQSSTVACTDNLDKRFNYNKRAYTNTRDFINCSGLYIKMLLVDHFIKSWAEPHSKFTTTMILINSLGTEQEILGSETWLHFYMAFWVTQEIRLGVN